MGIRYEINFAVFEDFNATAVLQITARQMIGSNEYAIAEVLPEHFDQSHVLRMMQDLKIAMERAA